jgi:5-methyltetrahydrofolate corrinoid/iron sulfur protein methyltransferase
MLLIGENLNVMVKKIGTAMKERDAKTIQEVAVAEAEAGVDYIDINLGPARKAGDELMEWIVKTVQEVVDIPLYLDTTNEVAIEAGLGVYQNKGGKAVINSIMARPERMEAELPLAQKYDAGFVALLWGPEGMPRDASERGSLAGGGIRNSQ